MSMLSKIAVAASIADFAVKKFFYDLLKVDTVAATGSLISDAAVLSNGRNVVTAANGTKAVRLPKAEVDAKVEVVNTSATQALIVFPELAADQINAITAGASLTMPGGSSANFYCDANGHWYAAVATAATADTAELAYLDGALSTNLVAEKAAILGTGGALTLGGALTAVTSIGIGSAVLSEAELEYSDGALSTNLVAEKAAILGTGGALTLGGALTAVTSIGIGSAVLTEAEMEMLDTITPGTGAASKAAVLDAGEDFTWPDTGVLTIGVLATATEAAEHGAGAIGTAATPTTKRWVERGGIIVTQTTFDLTGLASGGTANDVVGLAAGGAAYIGRNVVAANGVIFKMELSCLESPATGDGDIDIIADTSAALIGDGAYTGAIKINGGSLVVGQTVQNLVPAVTDDFYFYIAAVGAGGGTYTAGMFVLTTYGHAVLA